MSSYEALRRRLSAAQSSWRAADTAALLLRIVLGIAFFAHGAQKLFGWFGGGGVDGTKAFFDFLGIPAPELFAVVVGLTEFFGGLLLLAGLLTVVAGLALAVDMLVAIATFNRKNGFFVETANGGWELNFVLIAMALAVVVMGAGAWSLDRAIGLTRSA